MTHDACLQASNRITVLNNGDGIPVELHKEEKVYVPELIFAHLLTSSNYNDDEKKVNESEGAVRIIACTCTTVCSGKTCTFTERTAIKG